MESRSVRHRRRSPPPDGVCSRRLKRSSDRISALPDDMILLVLSRLGSVHAAARSSLLSRRWRGLWTRLADLAFYTDVADKIEAALKTCFSASPVVSSIDIHFPLTRDPTPLLHAAALLSPAELVFVLKQNFLLPCYDTQMVLPCFHRATSIELDVGLVSISLPAAGEFPMLEKLFLAGKIVDLGTLLGLCPRLHVLGLTFRGGSDLRSLDAHLDLELSFLSVNTRSLSYLSQTRSILHAMARLSPQKLVFTDNTDNTDNFGGFLEADLPCFQRATSIEMNLRNVRLTPLSDGEFSLLERLSLSQSSSIVDLDTFVSRCPRLRMLKVTVTTGDVTVHSASLRYLDVHSNTECHNIDIVAPLLKQLLLEVHAGSGRELSVSISTPMLEKVWWKQGYTTSSIMYGFWHLECATLERIQGDMCSQLPPVHALCLRISPIARGRMGSRPNFAKEMEKILIIDFSVLDLRLHTCGHVFGALMFRILRTCQIRAAMKKLKILLLQWTLDKQGRQIECQACPRKCPCDKPKNWRSQSIYLPRLEEVDIDGFNGEDHEHDFLRFISKCSPVLKKVTLKLAYTSRCRTTEIYNIFLASPSVRCYVYSSSGKLVQQASGHPAT